MVQADPSISAFAFSRKKRNIREEREIEGLEEPEQREAVIMQQYGADKGK